ncbi:MAG: ABC transporter permease [Elusimicrobia bacterium]|nr:ABC transporter permease [Elusimicrobiota bacterium]
MSLRRLFAVVLRQFYLIRGSLARLLPIFAWVLVDVVLWGFLARYLNSVSGSGFSFTGTLLGAVLLWDFFTRVMNGVTTAFFEDVWTHNFLNFFASPLRVSEYVAGLIVASTATSAIGLAGMLALARLAFGFSFAAYGALFVPFLLVLFLFGIAMGTAATAMVLRLGPASEWLVWPIPALVAPFAGVFYPLSVLPRWMRAVARVLPPAYVFEGLRALLLGGKVPPHALAAGAALAAVDLLLSAWLFAAVYRSAVRSGLLMRYSAESVS